MSRWVWDDDRTHDQPAAMPRQSGRPVLKWACLFLAWALVTGLLSAVHLNWLIWPLMVALIGYVVVDILRTTPRTR